MYTCMARGLRRCFNYSDYTTQKLSGAYGGGARDIKVEIAIDSKIAVKSFI